MSQVFSLKSYKIDHVVHGAIASAATYGAMMGASAEQVICGTCISPQKSGVPEGIRRNYSHITSSHMAAFAASLMHRSITCVCLHRLLSIPLLPRERVRSCINANPNPHNPTGNPQIESAIGMVVAHYIPFRAIRAGKQLSDSKVRNVVTCICRGILVDALTQHVANECAETACNES